MSLEENTNNDKEEETDDAEEVPFLSCMDDFMNLVWGGPRGWAKTFSESLEGRQCESYVMKTFQNHFEKDYLFDEATKEKIRNGDYDLEKEREKTREASGDSDLAPTFDNYLPYRSALSRADMGKCYYVWTDLAYGKKLTEPQRRIYMKFKGIIEEEQADFMTRAREHWNKNNCDRKPNTMKPEVLQYTSELWKARLNRISWYPKFYLNSSVVPLIDNTERTSQFIFVANVKGIGSPEKLWLREFCQQNLNIYSKLEDSASPPSRVDPVKYTYKPLHEALIKKGYHPDVSRDKLATSLAAEHNAHVVMSSSAFHWIVNNHEDSYNPAWDLPIQIKEDESTLKKVVFIDKRLVPSSFSLAERNQWYCKKRLLNVLNATPWKPAKNTFGSDNPNPECDILKLETFGILSDSPPSKKLRKTTEALEESSLLLCSGVSKSTHQKSDAAITRTPICYGSPGNSSHTDTEELSIDFEAMSPHKESYEPQKEMQQVPREQWRYQASPGKTAYNLWALTSETHSDLPNLKDLNVIIRCKVTAKLRVEGKLIDQVVLPKLEYQPLFGAEVPSLREISHDWCKVLIRPGSHFVRVRLDPLSGKLIMCEKKSLRELKTDLRRLYGCEPDKRLTSLHGLLDHLVRQPPGRYLLSHRPQSGPFATLYKEESENHNFNLNLNYLNIDHEYSTPSNHTYLPIDRMVFTPSCRAMKKLPATFISKKAKIASNLDNSLHNGREFATPRKPKIATKSRMHKKGKKTAHKVDISLLI